MMFIEFLTVNAGGVDESQKPLEQVVNPTANRWTSPTATTSIASFPGQTENEALGASTFMTPDGSMIAVGSPLAIGEHLLQNGKVVLYEKQADGSYQPSATIYAPFYGEEYPEGQRFGTSVVVTPDKEYIYVGAPGAGEGMGFVYIYQKTETGYSYNARFMPDTSRPFNAGANIAPAGNTQNVFVGAPGWSDNFTEEYGMVYVVNPNGMALGMFDSFNLEAYERFGTSVSGSADRSYVLVQTESKNIYVHKHTPEPGSDYEIFTLVQEIAPRVAGTSARHAVISSDGRFVFFSNPDDNGGRGSVDIYRRTTGDEFTYFQTIQSAESQVGANFGMKLVPAQDSNVLFVVSKSEGTGQIKSILVFGRSQTTDKYYLLNSVEMLNDVGPGFNISLATDAGGSVLAVGTPDGQVGQGADTGSGGLYIYKP